MRRGSLLALRVGSVAAVAVALWPASWNPFTATRYLAAQYAAWSLGTVLWWVAIFCENYYINNWTSSRWLCLLKHPAPVVGSIVSYVVARWLAPDWLSLGFYAVLLMALNGYQIRIPYVVYHLLADPLLLTSGPEHREHLESRPVRSRRVLGFPHSLIFEAFKYELQLFRHSRSMTGLFTLLGQPVAFVVATFLTAHRLEQNGFHRSGTDIVQVVLSAASLLLFFSLATFTLKRLVPAISSDERTRYVLYLRPFYLDDTIRIRKPHVSIMVKLVDFVTWHQPMVSDSLEYAIQDVLRPDIAVRAIGRPGDELPSTPFALSYVSDEHWKRWVTDSARRAVWVLILLDFTPGVLWELREVPLITGWRRVCLLLPPVKNRSEHDWLSRYCQCREDVAESFALPEPNDVMNEVAVGIVFEDGKTGTVVQSSKSGMSTRLELLRHRMTQLSGEIAFTA